MVRRILFLVICILGACGIANAGMILRGSGGGGTPLFSDTFETGDYSVWSLGEVSDAGNNLSVATDQKYAGTYALKMACDDNFIAYIEHDYGSALPTDIWVHFYIRFADVTATPSETGAWGNFYQFYSYESTESWPSSGIKFVFNDADPRVLSVFQVDYQSNVPNFDGVYNTVSISIDTWYEVKVHFKQNGAGSDVIEAWFGTPGGLSKIIDSSTLSFRSGWNIRYLFAGMPDSNLIAWNTNVYWIDNFAVAETNIW